MLQLTKEVVHRNGDSVNHEVCGGELGPPQTQSLLPVATEKSSLAHICKLSVDGLLTKKGCDTTPEIEERNTKNCPRLLLQAHGGEEIEPNYSTSGLRISVQYEFPLTCNSMVSKTRSENTPTEPLEDDWAPSNTSCLRKCETSQVQHMYRRCSPSLGRSAGNRG